MKSICSRYSSVLLLFVFACCLAKAEEHPGEKVVVNSDGSVAVPAQIVPVSSFLSPEAKAYLADHLRQMQDVEALKQDQGVPRFLRHYLERQKALFPVVRQKKEIADVPVYDYEPKDGVVSGNAQRVLIELHGGGFSGCWPGCAELESMPMVSLGGMRVVAVNYREGPENLFPAASEDVARVYRELLKQYPARNIGIYGCSAGGILTAQSVVWFQQHALPAPGAIGIYCASVGGAMGGDADYTALPLGEAVLKSSQSANANHIGYFKNADWKNALVSPVLHPDVLKKFPPTLLITGTRGFELGGALYGHQQLVKAGVDAELYVWEGLFHGFFYNPDVPESRDAYAIMVRFFDTHLGR
jgi:monoterpene epsilon-lactone hydrolase